MKSQKEKDEFKKNQEFYSLEYLPQKKKKKIKKINNYKSFKRINNLNSIFMLFIILNLK